MCSVTQRDTWFVRAHHEPDVQVCMCVCVREYITHLYVCMCERVHLTSDVRVLIVGVREHITFLCLVCVDTALPHSHSHIHTTRTSIAHTYNDPHTYRQIDTYRHTHRHIQTHTHTHIQTHTHNDSHTYRQTDTYRHTQTRTDTHTDTHTYRPGEWASR